MNCKSLSCRGLRSPLLFQASSRSAFNAFRLPRISHGGLFEIHVHFEPKNGSIPIPGLEFGNFGKRLTFFDEPTKIELRNLKNSSGKEGTASVCRKGTRGSFISCKGNLNCRELTTKKSFRRCTLGWKNLSRSD